jgi:hypothetical protein
MSSPDFDALVASTAAQIENLKVMIEAKKSDLARVRARDEAALDNLREEVVRLREVVADKRKYVEAAKTEYRYARRSSGAQAEPATDVVATAFLSFPNSTNIALEYGDLPLESLKPLRVRFPI